MLDTAQSTASSPVPAPALEPGRSESFPYPERLAHHASPLGPISYFDVGTETDLPPIILIHALGSNFTHWEYVAPMLARHTRVIGLDLPGCGHSTKARRKYSLREMSAAVVGLLDELNIPAAVIFGHSFGGRVAADVALNHPRRVLGLVLMNSSGFVRYPLAVRYLGSLVLRPPVVAPLIIHGVNRVLGRIFAAHNERTERFIRQVVERPDPRFAWEFAYYVCPMIMDLTNNVLDRLHELKPPTQVIWGAKDALLRYDGVAAWVQRMPDARLVVLPDCGHMPNLENPDDVYAAVLRFVRGVGSRLGAVEAQAS